ncbi:cytochrome P450, partial [Oryctes borbonicus]
NALDKEPVKEGIEMKDYMARLTTDIIGSIAFGIECNCIENPNAEFKSCARILLSAGSNATRILINTFPSLMKFLRVGVLPKEFSNFFMKAIKEIVDYRETNHVKRKGFLDLLLQLKNRGKIVNEMSDEIGGFETTSTTLSFLLYELCCKENIQEKLREEIINILQRHDNKVTYEALAEMKYVDMVLNGKIILLVNKKQSNAFFCRNSKKISTITCTC